MSNNFFIGKKFNIVQLLHDSYEQTRSGMRGGKEVQFPGRWIAMVAPKCPSASTFFNTAHFLPEDLRFEHGAAKVDSWRGRHLISLRPWSKRSILKTSFSVNIKITWYSLSIC